MSDNDRTETTSVSMELPLIERGRERAKIRRQSFSAYVASLIEADLTKTRRKSTSPAQPVTTEAGA
jgi:hypothetical protein